jgi:hypothetical protein
VREGAILSPCPVKKLGQSLRRDVIDHFRCLASVFRPVTIVTTLSPYCTHTDSCSRSCRFVFLAGLLCLTYCIVMLRSNPRSCIILIGDNMGTRSNLHAGLIAAPFLLLLLLLQLLQQSSVVSFPWILQGTMALVL